MREGLLSLLAFFGFLGSGLFDSLSFGTFAGLDGPFLDGQAGLGSAGLKGNLVILDRQDTTGKAANGNDLVTGLQACAQLTIGLFFLLLRTDQHEVEQSHHDDQPDDGKGTAAAGQLCTTGAGGIQIEDVGIQKLPPIEMMIR